MSCTNTFGAAQTNINNFTLIKKYVNLILEYKYDDAKKINFNNSIINSQIIQVAELLYQSGQTGKIESVPFSNSSFSQFLNSFFKAYNTLYINSNSSSSFKYFIEAHNIALNMRNKKLQQLALLGIQDVFNFQLRKTNKDRKHYLDKYAQLCENKVDSFHLKMNSLLFEIKENVTSLDTIYINSFDEFIQRFPQNHNFKSFYFATIAPLLTYLNNDQKAQNYYLKVITTDSLLVPSFKKRLFFRSYIKRSEYFAKNNIHDLALDALNKATKYLNNSDTIRSNFYIMDYKSRLFFNTKKYDSAYIYLKQANNLQTNIDYSTNNIEISKLNIKYQTAQKEKQILIEQQQKKKNKNIAYALGTLLLFGSILFFLIQKNTKRKQLLAEQEKELETQKLTTVLKEQELTAIDAMIEGQEKERQRIANDLHDDLGGLMANVKLHFNALKDKNSPELFDKTNMLIDEAYQKVRTVAHAKNSGVIAKQGLLKAVQNMAGKISASNKIEIHVIDYGLENRLENSLELTIFRIIQELITNVIKHAEATETTIHITNHDDSLNIMVEDNGKGFNTKNIAKNSGMGINSIDKRIENLGGTVTIESEINKGTTVIIDIPS